MDDPVAGRYSTHTESQNTPKWAAQAAQNVFDILPHLIDPDEEVPEIQKDDMAWRIATAFQDRAGWNRAIQEGELEPEMKLWLVVP